MISLDRTNRIPKGFLIAWAAVLALSIFMTFFRIGADALWYDESYSVAAAHHTFAEIIPMIGKDSHPPLYYLMLRAMILAAGDSATSVRALSALGIIALASLGFFPLRKIWGDAGGIAFALIVLFTPMSIVSAHEARMYSWVAFFVTAAVVWGYRALTERKTSLWIAASTFSLAASYTHYYGLLAVSFFWLILFAFLAFGKDRKNLVSGCVTGAITVALYAPWMYFLLSQASRVAKSYWIGPVTTRGTIGIVAYPFLQKFSGRGIETAMALVAAVLIVSIAGIVRGYRKKDSRTFLALSGIAVYALTLTAAIVISVKVKPILVDRYMISCMGILLLAFVSFWVALGKPRVLFAMVAVFAIANAPMLGRIYGECVNGPMDMVKMALEDRVGPDDIFVHGSEHNFGTFSYYFPNNRHFLYVPEGFVPNGNYGIFAPNGSYGQDFSQFNEKPVTLWVTNRVGEQYTLPAKWIFEKAHRRAVGVPKKFVKVPGWYTVLVQEVAFDPSKVPAETAAVGKGKLTVKIDGIAADKGKLIMYALYNSDPIGPNTFIASGAIKADAAEARVDLGEFEYGSYVFVAFHDMNENSMPDFKDGKNLEGFGMGMDPSTLKEGAGFDDMKFSFTEGMSEKEIRMFYPD